METYCSTGPSLSDDLKRLYGFGLLPLVPQATTESLVSTVEQVASLPHLKGVIMGTRGVGKGLDDEALDPVWAAIEKAGLVVFLHPHYGVDKNAWGEKANGHVLPLALGFPFETTIVRLPSPFLLRILSQTCSPGHVLGNDTPHPIWGIRSLPQSPRPPRALRRRPPPTLLPPCVLYRA